jgi:sugar-specific transcriptional regulator TrmB
LTFEDEKTQVLVDLGLTVLQAKVYIALASTGVATGRAAAKAAKVASQDVYRVLSELQDSGLVEKIIGKPFRYKAVSPANGLRSLLAQRNKKTEEIWDKILVVLNSFENIKETEDNSCNFVLVPQTGPMNIRISGIFKSAQRKIDLMNDFSEGVMLHDRYFESRVNAIRKGVQIRDILINPESKQRMPASFLELLKKKPLFQAKYVTSDLALKLIIKDNKELLISTMANVASTKQPFLWSDNPVLVCMVVSFYEVMWEKASEDMKT